MAQFKRAQKMCYLSPLTTIHIYISFNWITCRKPEGKGLRLSINPEKYTWGILQHCAAYLISCDL